MRPRTLVFAIMGIVGLVLAVFNILPPVIAALLMIPILIERFGGPKETG